MERKKVDKGLHFEDAQKFSALYLSAIEQHGWSVQQAIRKARIALCRIIESESHYSDHALAQWKNLDLNAYSWRSLTINPRKPLSTYERRAIALAFAVALDIPREIVNRIGGGI